MSRAETVRTGKAGKKELRLVRKDARFFGLADGIRCVEGEDAEDVWRRLHDDAGKSDPRYFGFDGARARFLHFFPNGFHSKGYTERERDYKLKAKAKLSAGAPLEKAIDGSGYGEAVLAAFQATNLLSMFEMMRLQEALRGPKADEFIRAAARFTKDGDKANLSAMERALKDHDSAKWTMATYLPFLWRPDTHIFLKPEVTKDFATRVGYRFAFEYEPRLNLPVYESLLDLKEKTGQQIQDLAPRDGIDIQSFIWVIGDYRDGRDGVYL
jgi:hypothetical protein